MKKQTFALYFGNRGFMPAELIEGAREERVTRIVIPDCFFCECCPFFGCIWCKW